MFSLVEQKKKNKNKSIKVEAIHFRCFSISIRANNNNNKLADIKSTLDKEVATKKNINRKIPIENCSVTH